MFDENLTICSEAHRHNGISSVKLKYKDFICLIYLITFLILVIVRYFREIAESD